MNQPRTICVKCKHHIGQVRAGQRTHLCLHPLLGHDKFIDPVTGEEAYMARAVPGRPWLSATNVAHPECITINSGDCEWYEEKPCES